MTIETSHNIASPQAEEGVIKYQVQHTPAALEIPSKVFAQLTSWRSLLFQLQLLGQNPQLYGGLAYGNISQRIAWGNDQFWITATQTSHLPVLAPNDYTKVLNAEPLANLLFSEGEQQPSSEALTHASVYQANAQAKAVLHVHSPAIWRQTEALQLVHTARHVAYGTPAMAFAVAAMFKQGLLTEQGVFTMLGHEDGVVVYADSLENAGLLLIKTLTKAMALAPEQLYG